MALRLFLRASWGSAILGALVVAWLVGTLPRTLAALDLPYFLVGHMGIVCWAVAVGLALCFLVFAFLGAPEALALIPGVFALGQLPVLWHLLQRRGRGVS